MTREEYEQNIKTYIEYRPLRVHYTNLFFKRFPVLNEENKTKFVEGYKNEKTRKHASHNLRKLQELYYAELDYLPLAKKTNKLAIYGLYCYEMKTGIITLENIEKMLKGWNLIYKPYNTSKDHFQKQILYFYNLLIKNNKITGEIKGGYSKEQYENSQKAKEYSLKKILEWEHSLDYFHGDSNPIKYFEDGTCINMDGFIELMTKLYIKQYLDKLQKKTNI